MFQFYMLIVDVVCTCNTIDLFFYHVLVNPYSVLRLSQRFSHNDFAQDVVKSMTNKVVDLA